MNMIQKTNHKLLYLLKDKMTQVDWLNFILVMPEDPYRAREYLTKKCDELNIEWRQP